jgi:osmoprotectant transport system ATP-binding protein
VLVVDNDHRPLGWLATGTGDPPPPATGQVTPQLLNLGGTLARESGTLREALDAALSSPSGRGVAVTDEGRYAGTVTATQVLALIERRAAELRARQQTEPAGQPSGAREKAGEAPTETAAATGTPAEVPGP